MKMQDNILYLFRDDIINSSCDILLSKINNNIAFNKKDYQAVVCIIDILRKELKSNECKKHK